MNLFKILHFFAQTSGKINASEVNIKPVSATDVLAGALNVVYFAAGATAVIVIILAGYSFTTAVYDPAKIAIAKNAILYSVVGLVVIMMAFVATQFILGRF